MVEPWYKRRGYLHFDAPISFSRAKEIISSPSRISSHSFWPFIRNVKTIRRYKPKEKRVVKKERILGYCAHADSHIYSYYSWTLNNLYEKKIKSLKIDQSVLAYRKFPNKKCNIDFANEAFELIKKHKNCSVIAMDIEGFFDNINHHLLKSSWAKLLGHHDLPNDQYAVFKAITRYSWIPKKTIYEKFRPTESSRRICEADEFRAQLASNNVIQKNKKQFGIPQGSPISAFLSNLYLLDFDVLMVEVAKNNDSEYRRYSDDILVICPSTKKDFMLNFVKDAISEMRLKISDPKTKTSEFSISPSGIQTCDKPIQYLGFEFNGKGVYVRSGTISKFQRRIREDVKKAKKIAKFSLNKGGKGTLYKKALYRKYSHLGKNNFVGYLKRSERIMKSNLIKRQGKKSWKLLNDVLEKPLGAWGEAPGEGGMPKITEGN